VFIHKNYEDVIIMAVALVAEPSVDLKFETLFDHHL